MPSLSLTSEGMTYSLFVMGLRDILSVTVSMIKYVFGMDSDQYESKDIDFESLQGSKSGKGPN